MNYIVQLNNNPLEEEDFNQNDNNIGLVTVYNENGEDISKKCRVQISLTRDGMLGFGKELIRLAHNYKDGKHYHIDPISNESFSETIGIVLQPNSCELIITCGNNDKKIKDYLDK